MRLFITDSGDFTRSAFATKLAEARDVALEQPGKKEAVAWSDPDQLVRELEGADCIIHATRPIPARMAADREKWQLVAGTENLLNAALEAGVRRFVLVSTADVSLHRAPRVNWGELREPPREKVVGQSARLARLAEEIALGFNLRGLETIALRPAWLWGPGMPDPRSKAEQERECGMRLPGGGDNFVATTHIDNLANAVARAVDADTDGIGHSYYICDNEMLDAVTFFSEISRALELPEPRLGPGLRTAYLRSFLEERRRGPDLWRSDVIRRGYATAFDTLSARKHLHWAPSVDFRSGISAMTPALKLVEAP